MKIQIKTSDLKKPKATEISDKIKLGYSLKEINATLTKDTIVKQTWTKDQKTYLDGMEDRLNTRIDGVNTRIDGVEDRLNTRINNLEHTVINLFKLNGFKVK